jgi:hypothetical protein
MTAVDTVLPAIGDVAAGVAAVAAVIGLRYARQTVREARAERWAGEHARLVRRLEWVGETIEHVDRLAEEDQRIRPQGETWRRGRSLLAQGFVGLAELLPQTARLVDCADPYSARSMAMLAREEVAGQLARLARRQPRLLLGSLATSVTTMTTTTAISPMMTNVLSIERIQPTAIKASQMARITPRIVHIIRPMYPVCAVAGAGWGPSGWPRRDGRLRDGRLMVQRAPSLDVGGLVDGRHDRGNDQPGAPDERDHQ